MSQYEHDYLDPTETPGFEPGDELPSNLSANPTFYDVIDQALASRRGFLAGGLAVMATGLFGNVLGGRAALASGSALMGFKPIPVSMDDTVVVPEGYKWQVLGAWGEPILGDMPAFAADNTATQQAQQVGQHHDGMHFFPLDGSSEDGLLVLNHEYVEPRFLHAALYQGMTMDSDAVLITDGKRSDEEVQKEINAHGISVYRTRKGANGWEIVADPHNRRITAATHMELSGPVRGSAHVRTKYSPEGHATRGTLNNCAHGVTPWNTYMSAEENWAGYFVNFDQADGKPNLPREHKRFGVSDKERSRYGWELAASGADDFVRFNASTLGADATQDYRNEPNTFGYNVEIDPLRPNAQPAKRVAMGRFAHEAAVCSIPVEGQPLAFYMGCDSRNEYIYKFVSTAVWDPADVGRGMAAGDKYLNEGKLYVARFNDDGSGAWIELTKAAVDALTTPYTAYTFDNQADVLVNARHGASALGATKMDRPEWGAINPKNGEVYFCLTNTNLSSRGVMATDAANPRAFRDSDGNAGSGNPNGHIIRFKEAAGASTAVAFTWDIFLFGAEEDAGAGINLSGLSPKNDFSSALNAN